MNRRSMASIVRTRALAGSVSVGGTVVPLRAPLEHALGFGRQEMSPRGYLAQLPDALKPALKWLAQKDVLGQDALLISSPAERARARCVALAYAELVNAELEYVAISADTTEADLKQRRELLAGGNVSFSDSPAVRAATRGGILILDGLERAERNVLPTLNNLLENREMALEDGRFLMDERRFEALKASLAGHHEIPISNLQPVHHHFRVVALASPSPPFPGRPLDPPLRSRFQGLLVPPMSPEELASRFVGLPSDIAGKLVSASETIAELERHSLRHDGPASFFSFSFTSLARHCSQPLSPTQQSPYEILERVYPPLNMFGSQDSSNAHSSLKLALKKLGIVPKHVNDDGDGTLIGNHFRTSSLTASVAAIEQDLASGRNVLIVGRRGSGKSAILRSLGHGKWLTFAMHRDLTARDLLQRRVTDQASGASQWADQPCVAAARVGSIAILDGVHRLPKGALVSAMSRLCIERELDLPDGSRLVDAVRCEDADCRSSVQPLPSSFQLVALAEPGDWLSPELASLFSVHALPELSPFELKSALAALVPQASEDLCQHVSDIAVAALTTETDASFSASERAALRLSTRVLLRLARRASSSNADAELMCTLLHDSLMSRFLPMRLQQVIDGWLAVAGLKKKYKSKRKQSAKREDSSPPEMRIDGADVVCGKSRVKRRVPSRPELVPSPRNFFGSPAALKALEAILQCEHSGEHAVLLLGNQGVGKNVAVDRVLELLRAEREYVQLHRDTTVSSLTVRPVIEDGKLSYEDAPLVRAAKYGRVCVLDEADKAPIEVVVILKALVEDGELYLADGRRLLGGSALAELSSHYDELPEDIIPIHADFRLWVLANPPGFPFHGNSFFRECGDAFAAIALNNPDVQSETSLLQHVAPTYPHREDLKKLAHAFAELRKMAESGSIAYPYSMREAVAVARHLEMFHEDTLVDALQNVLSFEAFDAPLRRQLGEVFEAHGFHDVVSGLEGVFSVVAGEAGSSRTFGKGSPIDIKYIPLGREGGESSPRTGMDGPKHGEVDPTGAPHVGGNRWAGGSGGSDTAGLGGRGGPYRLWDGNPVYQVSDAIKNEVSEDAKNKARALAHQAWQQRLEEIEKMDDKMWSMYHNVLGNVEPQVAQLHAILMQAQDKKFERVWLRNRSDGELDDARLVEGVAGERLVFKRRGFVNHDDKPMGESESRKKRRICFVMDCSGSMYRFNGLDGRLNRMLEATCLILESMQGHSDKYEYALVGHSGESAKVKFVEFGKPPASRGDRLKVLQRMVAHTQFCMAGDNTIEATHAAIDEILNAIANDAVDHGDDDLEGSNAEGRAFVVVLSDANFRRYQMDPLWWSEALMRDSRVKGHAIMIGSLGEEAAQIRAALPPGHGHIVLDTGLLPATFRSIFEQAGILQNDF